MLTITSAHKQSWGFTAVFHVQCGHPIAFFHLQENVQLLLAYQKNASVVLPL